MLIFDNRVPRPDEPHWPCRRWLAAIDALGWPALVAWMVLRSPVPMDAVRQLAIACLCAFARLRRAVWFKHR
jgi:hypothetical protein